MLVYMILSQGSLKLFTFKKILLLSWWGNFHYLFAILMGSFPLPVFQITNLILLHPLNGFISVIVFFIYVWFLFMLSNALLKISNLSVYSSTSENFDCFCGHYLEFFNWWTASFHFTLFIFWSFIFFLPLEHVPLLPHFTLFAVFISVFLVRWLHFTTLEKSSFVRSHLL